MWDSLTPTKSEENSLTALAEPHVHFDFDMLKLFIKRSENIADIFINLECDKIQNLS